MRFGTFTNNSEPGVVNRKQRSNLKGVYHPCIKNTFVLLTSNLNDNVMLLNENDYAIPCGYRDFGDSTLRL